MRGKGNKLAWNKEVKSRFAKSHRLTKKLRGDEADEEKMKNARKLLSILDPNELTDNVRMSTPACNSYKAVKNSGEVLQKILKAIAPRKS